jgi:hypothetical protein
MQQVIDQLDVVASSLEYLGPSSTLTGIEKQAHGEAC